MRATRRPRTIVALLAVATVLLGLPASVEALAPAEPTGSATTAKPGPQKLREHVAYFSTHPMLLLARTLGMRTIAGKSINGPSRPSGHRRGARLEDVAIGVHPTKHENEPTVAANPKHPRKLVAGSHFFGPPAPESNRCVAYHSSNGGRTWSAPVAMRQLGPTSQCSDPVLAYAPDGSRVYYAYMDIKFEERPDTFAIDLDIVVSYSNNDGRTWTGPIVALNGSPTTFTPDPDTTVLGFQYDKPWIGTSLDDKSWVYVTATRFDDFAPGECHIAFARSAAKGRAGSWRPPAIMDQSAGGCGNPVVVQGSRPAGGRRGELLVAWYHSGSDGWLQGSFQIRTRRSRNHGRTFGPIRVAASDSFEAPFALGPQFFYHRWWGTMFPDVEIDGRGRAHVLYTHDPVAGSETAEDGDVRYVSSARSPYRRWSSPVTVNDDGLQRAQGYAALDTQRVGKGVRVHALWEDHRLSPEVPIDFPDSPNLYYDMFAASKTVGRGGWSRNRRVSDASSISDFEFIGDYNDLTGNHLVLFGIWTDRRHQTDIFAMEDNVFGSRVATRQRVAGRATAASR
jgi:hypothetical protein